jgi:hypothetical protein
MGCHFCGHDQTIKSAYMAVSYFQIGVIRFDNAKVCYRCITAAQGSAATVRFGSKGHSGSENSRFKKMSPHLE